jgi:Tol biopolymer transport system component
MRICIGADSYTSDINRMITNIQKCLRALCCLMYLALITADGPPSAAQLEPPEASFMLYLPLVTNNYSLDKLAFTSDLEGNRAVYVVNPDGTGPQKLTPDDLWVVDYDWAPDGNTIAFTNQTPDIGIYLLHLNGGRVVELMPEAHDPSWSPTGTKIAFKSYRPPEPGEIFTINIDGTDLKNVTHSAAHENSPAWSPLGNQIAFVSFMGQAQGEIFVIAVDGTQRVNLTNNPANDFGPTWSPDGSQIAFISDRDGNWEIYAMNSDGTGLVNLTQNDSWESSPTWSPDGEKIAFVSSRDEDEDIFIMNADGTGQTNLTGTDFPATDAEPSWSPDGHRIAFTSSRDGRGEIYVINIDGTGLKNMTNNFGSDAHPKWRPR